MLQIIRQIKYRIWQDLIESHNGPNGMSSSKVKEHVVFHFQEVEWSCDFFTRRPIKTEKFSYIVKSINMMKSNAKLLTCIFRSGWKMSRCKSEEWSWSRLLLSNYFSKFLISMKNRTRNIVDVMIIQLMDRKLVDMTCWRVLIVILLRDHTSKIKERVKFRDIYLRALLDVFLSVTRRQDFLKIWYFWSFWYVFFNSFVWDSDFVVDGFLIYRSFGNSFNVRFDEE